MSFQGKIEEMIELMQVPVIAKYLIFSFEEAKEVFKEEIEKFRLIKNQFESNITESDDTINSLFSDLSDKFGKRNNSVNSPDWEYSKRCDRENYIEMFNTMECDYDLKEHVFKEFFLKLKPFSNSE